jgi:hypothetical protein
MVGFSEESIDKSVESWPDIQRYNECLARLIGRRKPAVKAEGAFATSKTAWKCAVLQQALLYRATTLAEGCAASWRDKHLLTSMLAARALIETVVLANHIGDELHKFTTSNDLDSTEHLLNSQLFSTKNKALVDGGFAHMAPSIMKFIDKFEKKIPMMREHYEFMSEWCHPNGSGAFFTFGDLNKLTGEVRFSEVAERARGIEGHIISSYVLLVFMEPTMDRFDQAIEAILLLDHGASNWI